MLRKVYTVNTMEMFHEFVIKPVDLISKDLLSMKWVLLRLKLRPPRGVWSDVLTKSQQLSIIKVTIDIRVLKVYIA